MLSNSDKSHFLHFVPMIIRQLGKFMKAFKRKYFFALQEVIMIKKTANEISGKVGVSGWLGVSIRKAIDEEFSLEEGESGAVYLDEPEYFRELTPRMIVEEPSMKIKLLRKKRNKLQKKIEADMRLGLKERLQEEKIVSDVKVEKLQRQRKKEVFILQKQTEEAKKYSQAMKKAKKIRKAKGGKSKK